MTKSLKFLIKITCIYVLVGRKKYIPQWFDCTRKIKILWLAKLHNFITLTWSLFLKTPILKIQFSILKACVCYFRQIFIFSSK